MVYQFDTELAAQLGVDEAIMLQNIVFWIIKNKANDRNYYDNKYWTYNSIKAFEQLFPFWSVGQIRRIIKSLHKKGVIEIGDYNEDAHNHTHWYALTDSYNYLIDFQNQRFDLLKSTHRFNEIDKSIYVHMYTDSKPDSKQIDVLNLEKYSEIMNEWFEYKRSRNQSYKSTKSKEAALKRLIELSGDSVEVAAKIINQSIANNWSGLFELKHDKQTDILRTVGVEPDKTADYSQGWDA